MCLWLTKASTEQRLHWMMSADSTYLMEGSSEILPVIVSRLPKLFELLLSKVVVIT